MESRMLTIGRVLVAVLGLVATSSAAEWYVALDGTPNGKGTPGFGMGP